MRSFSAGDGALFIRHSYVRLSKSEMPKYEMRIAPSVRQDVIRVSLEAVEKRLPIDLLDEFTERPGRGFVGQPVTDKPPGA